MFILKVATFFLVALAVGAEKKIELQDIEEDNLRSEMRTEDDKEVDKSDSPQTSGSADTGPGYSSLDFMKNGLLRYFDNSQTQTTPQQQRYVHQYAVTEQPERHAPPNKAQYGAPQQAMVGYLSNIPMQIYLVPQYYSDQTSQQHQASGAARGPTYLSAPDNYIEVPSFVPPSGKTYIHHYAPPPPPMGYFTISPQQTAPPTAAPPQATISPVVAYPFPIYNYNQASTSVPKDYYPNLEYSDTNSVDEISEQEQKQYNTQTGVPAPATEYPRHYNSRMPIREEYRHNTIPELPHPNPLLLKAPPPHLAHIPKILPVYRPLTKPVYQGGGPVPNSYTSRPHEHYGPPQFKKRPSSLLDSYIPSSLQLEYLKRGLIKDPLAAYDVLANARYHQLVPRHYERGFLPNQMYHTAAGGVTFGHYKRTPKVDKITHKP